MGTIIGIIVAIAGLAISVLTYIYTREDRHLDYQIIINTQLLHPDAATLGGWLRLRLSYGDEYIDDPYLIVVQLINTGNRPIRPEEQVEPIHIDFGDTVRVLYAETVEGSRVETDIYLEEHHVKIPPVLFNQGDWIAVKLLTDRKGTPDIRGRIVGVREFRPCSPAAYTRLERWISLPIGSIALSLYVLGLTAISIRGLPNVVIVGVALGIPASFFIGLFVTQALIDRRVRKRREAFRVNV
jgi:hypothetical protein